MQSPKIKIISAGAGSGKTYRLTQELSALLSSGAVRPSGIIATTFTNKAAAELRERVRVKLLSLGERTAAQELSNALIGTVHGLGVKLLQRFAFEAGVSPQVDIIPDDDQQRLFNLSLAASLSMEFIEDISLRCEKLGLGRADEPHNWRGEVLRMVEMIRANDLDAKQIEHSRKLSWESLADFLPEAKDRPSYWQEVEQLLTSTATALENNPEDSTKKTLTIASRIRKELQQLKRRGFLPWPNLVGMLSKGVGVKSKSLIVDLQELIDQHLALNEFQEDLRKYKDALFDCAIAAIDEFDRYKKSRGQIDYTDMEVLVLRLLDQPEVRATLAEELDLLMVDEFQDTSPIQLAIFLRLSQLAKQSIWVGDPKQSIYGFRGADPQLMQAVIEALGGLQAENILDRSWRSRADIVHLCNDIFTRAFPELSKEAVALKAVRTRKGNDNSLAESEAQAATAGLQLWAYEVEGGGRKPAQSWYNQMIARSIAELLADPPEIRPKGSQQYRPVQAGDIAVLVRSNKQAVWMAEALHDAGLTAAVARTGLLQTAESILILASLRYLLNPEDSLAVAELMLLGEGRDLSQVIDDRLNFLEVNQGQKKAYGWGQQQLLPKAIDDLRERTQAYAPSEAFNLLLEQLDLRRTIASWGRGEQRLSNLDELRRLAVEYEQHAHQRQQAASLGGLLLYFNRLQQADRDTQSSGEGPTAINVLTYHKSKGLEWPVVVCHDLHNKLRADVFGAQIEARTTGFDPQAPLAGRWLRYWTQAYGLLKNNLQLLDKVGKSDWQKNANQRALGEEARLLYVGLTRPRDILILPLGSGGTPWLDRVYHHSLDPPRLIEQDESSGIFSWEDELIPQQLQRWTAPRSLPKQDQSLQAIRFLSGERAGLQAIPPFDLPLESLAHQYPGPKPDQQQLQYYAAVPEIDPAYADQNWATACRKFILADFSKDASLAEREQMAETIWQAWLPEMPLQVDLLLEQADGLKTWMQQNIGKEVQYRSLYAYEGRIQHHRLKGAMDLVAFDDKQLVVFQAPELRGKKWFSQLRSKAAHLYWQAQLFGHLHHEKLTGSYVWLPGQSACLPLSIAAPNLSLYPAQV